MMKDIGGYFELELSMGQHHYHDTPYMMKSGRSSLHCILTLVKPALVYIPFYTCDALLEPFDITGVHYEFYPINEKLEPAIDIDLAPGAYFLYVNYLDIKRDTVARLSEKYKDKLIVDCTQAFFMTGNYVSWFFNSCRKFFGVPDGSYLYAPAGIPLPIAEGRNENYIVEHLVKRFNGHTSEGYEYFLKNEEMADSGIYEMSKLSTCLLSAIDYDRVIEKRRANYNYLHQRLGHLNYYPAAPASDNAPMYYPLLTDRDRSKSILSAQRIFIPSFWKDVQEREEAGFALEKMLSALLWPLPVDHRYTVQDIEVMAEALLNQIV